jgi:hypothetical protein
MRVEIVSEIANLKDRLLPSRNSPAKKVDENHALAKLCAALRGKDSFLRLQDFDTGFMGRSGEAYGAYAGRFMLTFQRLDLSGDHNLHLVLLQMLMETLKKVSSSDALFVKMCVTPPTTQEAGNREHSLILQLEAIAVTPEQAELRWCSGIPPVQEALLFVSQLLRQHVVKTGL